MKQEEYVGLLARLEAIETLLAIAISGSYVTAGLTAEQVRVSNDALVEKFRTRSFHGAPAAPADHYADEVRHHLETTLRRVAQAFEDAQ